MSQRVFVAMSGGVDSAAAALLLRQAGYNVTGVTLRLHPYKDRPGLCGSADDIETARAVAAGMGIPHVVLDLCDLFRERVMDRFVWAYTHGRTPNPCIDCNREIKFGALLDWALDQGADAMATGHYARVRLDTPSGRWQLLRGADRRKDQTYFLYQLTQHQLAHLLLPVGDYEKPALRALAAANGLSNAQKADSQDICFVPDGDYVSFLRQYGGVEPVPGDFLDSEGRVLGRHRGMECYTIGQRKGLGVSANAPQYVLGKDPDRNAVILGEDNRLYTRELTAERVNWLSVPEPDRPLSVTAKTRYSGTAARRPHPHGVHRASAGRHPGAGGGVLRWRSGAGRGHHLSVTQKDAAKAASCSSYR